MEEGHATCGELDLRARATAPLLQTLGARGERALLRYSGQEDITWAVGEDRTARRHTQSCTTIRTQ